ncbi:MAG: SUMF1/EgtB/PvdO family nonheme iron enzyme [Desulfuromonadales bacterium]|nr:SUMF1/EgtB/PvdO family nonheme iron enzyme [Desulfuromonadales bacterium]
MSQSASCPDCSFSLSLAATRGISIVAKDPATGESGEVRLYNKSYAVIVGIDRYKNLPADKQLSNAVRDAQGVAEVLRRNYQFDEIITLTDEQATKERIMRLLTTDLPKKMSNEDALFVFWAGHGNQQKNVDGDLGYLIPYDGSVDAIYRNITMAEIRDTISKTLPAKHVFYVMDACYSGLLATKRSLDGTTSRDLGYLREITKERVRQVLTAGSKGQEALDGGPNGHSVFTGRLIEALEAAGDFVTANEIQTILKEKVYQDARARNHNQTPGFGTLYGSGDFVFVPNVRQKVADVAAEVAKLEAEMAELARQEAAARKSQNEVARREAERQRQIAEAKLKAEKLRQEQLAAEAQRQEQLRREQQQHLAKVQQQEAELAARRSEEEQRLAALKAEIEAKRQRAPATQSATIEAAVAEIRRLAQEIDSIEAAFAKEQPVAEKRIVARYAALLAEVKAQEKAAKGKPLVQDMFETAAEFAARKKNATGFYRERRKELEAQRLSELTALRQRIDQESRAQTAPLRQELATLSNKDYPIDPTSLALHVGRYDIDRGVFPFTLANKSKSATVQVAMNGTIRLGRDDAKEWYGQLQNGFVRPQVTARPGGKVVQVALANDVTDELLLTLVDGEFLSARGIRERERERERERLNQLTGGMEFVFVPGGCYPMGNQFGDGDSAEQLVHEVCVDSFRLGKFEVTQGQWRKVMGSNPSYFKNGDNYPVEQVSWNDVQQFLRKLNRQTGKTFRLPTEAEWEYACRSGGKIEKYCGGSDVDSLAWYSGNSGSKTHPVAQKQPNGLGLYDMSGNVWEWCQDRYDSVYYGKSPRNNPQGQSKGSNRVNRGGSWNDGPALVRSVNRFRDTPGYRVFNLGFRLAFPARSER